MSAVIRVARMSINVKNAETLGASHESARITDGTVGGARSVDRRAETPFNARKERITYIKPWLDILAIKC